MGRVISDLAAEDAQVKIVAGIDFVTEQNYDYPVYPSILDCKEEADVVIDFSSPAKLNERLAFSVEKKMPIVFCTTGLSEEEFAQVQETSKKVAILRSANMSLGVNTLLKLVAAAAKVFAAADFDIEIVEKHHNRKVDAPSGTALAIADAMNEVLEDEYMYKYDRSKERKMRDKKEIGISAVRGGTIVGEHEVLFAGLHETVTISHSAASREILANGAVCAALFVADKPKGAYSMKDIFTVN
jgi:4-hydroxy-tetrahydrodipicolinate reductase